MTVVQPAYETLDWRHLDRLVDLTDCAMAPDGRHAALVSQHWDRANDCFVSHLSLLFLDANGFGLRWATTLAHASVRNLRFAPNGNHLAYIRTAEDGQGDCLIVHNPLSGQVTNVSASSGAIADFAWSADAKHLFSACETQAERESTSPVLVLTSIPERLPWRRVAMHISRVSFDPDARAPSSAMRLTEDMVDLNNLAVSPDGRLLVVTEERSEGGTHTSVYLNEVDIETLSLRRSLRVPGPLVGLPQFSPDSRRLAYVGSRVPGLSIAPRRLGDLPDVDVQTGYGSNVYDTRVHIVDVQHETIAQLATDASLAAGIPNGLSPVKQQVHWLSDDELRYVATAGHQTVMCTQRIDDDAVLTVQSIGSGASRGHSFAANGTCFATNSDDGAPFAPALVGAEGDVHVLRERGYQWDQPDLAWHRPALVEDAPAPSAWVYLPRGAPAVGRSVPLVVQVYGGATPLGMAFDATHQILVSHGYAVLVVNSSGCSGAGPHVADRHINDLGRRAGADVIATTRHVLDRFPELDPGNVGVYGGSYGGFLVWHLLAVSRVFRAGCAMAAMTNLAHYWGGSRFGHQYGMSAMSGSFPWTHREAFVDASPIFSADKITAPVLLIHGGRDSIVPVSEAEQMFVALKTLGREVVLAILPDEEHPMRSCPSAQLATRHYLVDWFDTHLRDHRS